jgi:hypothetical protein
MTDNADGVAAPPVATVAAAGQTAESGPDADTTPGGELDHQHDNGPDDNPDDSTNREAAKWRRKLRVAQREFDTQRTQLEAERDQLRDQLDTMRQDTLTQIATEAGLPDYGLLTAAGHELDSFITEDGTVDRDRVSQACADTMNRFNITPKGRAPRPNHQQPGGGQPRATDGWKAAFAPRPRP